MSRLYVDRISPYQSASVTVDGLDTSTLTTKTTFNAYTSSNDSKVTSLINATGSYASINGDSLVSGSFTSNRVPIGNGASGLSDSELEANGATLSFPPQSAAAAGNTFVNINTDSDLGNIYAAFTIQDRGSAKDDAQIVLNSYTGLDGSLPVFQIRAGGNSAGGQNNAIVSALSNGTAEWHKTSTWVSGTKFNIGGEFNIAASDPLPSGVVGDLAVSGSNLYFHNGTEFKEVSFV